MSTRLHHRAVRRVPVAIVAGAAALALSGCGADPAPAAPPAPPRPAGPTAPLDATAPGLPSEQTVAWTDTVCGALTPVTESLTDPPEFDLSAPAATREAYVSYLTEAQAAVDRALEGVSAAGPAPVDDGAR